MPIIRCRHCGKIIPPESDYCPNCGHSTENQVVDTYGSSAGEAGVSCLKGILMVVVFCMLLMFLIEMFPGLNSVFIFIITVLFTVVIYILLFKRDIL